MYDHNGRWGWEQVCIHLSPWKVELGRCNMKSKLIDTLKRVATNTGRKERNCKG